MLPGVGKRFEKRADHLITRSSLICRLVLQRHIRDGT